MDMTIAELTSVLDPVMTPRQLAALLRLAAIEPAGVKRTGHAGRPAAVYNVEAAFQAHGLEAKRTSKQFSDNDWLASALLGRGLIRADAAAGELWWPDGTRAETLAVSLYGYVHVNPCKVPAHRVVWISAEGEIPAPLQVNHINRRRFDNRRANLELVTFENNIRHAHGKTEYINYHDAVRELAALEPQPETINPYGGALKGGRLVFDNDRSHRHRH
jgi:hypothetical protein